jgi:hypothetical protein
MTHSKNFVVTGTPRSGTTFFCNTLKTCPGIWIPEFSNIDNAEPFNPVNTVEVSNALQLPLFDQNAVVQKLIKNKTNNSAEYFGFKTFLAYHNNMSLLVEHNQLDVFVILRKNIWSVLASFLLAQDNKNYNGSSKRFSPFYYDGSNREERRIFTMFYSLCKDYWYSESVWASHPRLVEKIYFEDLIEPGASFEKINQYFEQKINFDAHYTKDSIEKYFENFGQVKEIILRRVHNSKHHFLALPQYLLTELDL